MNNTQVPEDQIEAAVQYAIKVFSSKEKALHWLSKPSIHLKGQMPLDALYKQETHQEVINMLGRIENGIFS